MFGLIVSGLLGVAFAGFYIFMFSYDAFNAQTWWAHPVCIGGVLICLLVQLLLVVLDCSRWCYLQKGEIIM